MDKETLYSVGHSNHSFEEFLQLIEAQGIDCIIDVRSMPYSKHTPQFNSDVLKARLNSHGILYAHFGEEFGARRTDCLKDAEFKKKGVKEIHPQVNFEIGVTTAKFLQGAERLKKALSQGRRVSLMCSESDPLGCHRFSFVSRYFHELGWNVRHIVRDEDSGESCWVSHADLEKKMILAYVAAKKLQELPGQLQSTLFLDFGDEYDETQQRIDAYRLKNHEIGWTPTDNEEFEHFND